MSNSLLCKDCKHSFVPLTNKVLYLGMTRFIPPVFYFCSLTKKETQVKFNPVTGPKKVQTQYQYCELERLRQSDCGIEGRNWEPKHKKHLFLAITRGTHEKNIL